MVEQLNFPVRDRDEPFATELPSVLGSAARRGLLSESEVPIVRQVGLLLAGAQTFGEAEDRLEAMNPTERGEMVARARAAAGLPEEERPSSHRTSGGRSTTMRAQRFRFAAPRAALRFRRQRPAAGDP